MSSGSVVVTVTSNGLVAFTIPVAVCRRALVAKQGDDRTGSWDTYAGIAAKMGVSRQTVSAFFGGGRVSIVVARRIVAVLGLEWAAVAVAINEPVKVAS